MALLVLFSETEITVRSYQWAIVQLKLSQEWIWRLLLWSAQISFSRVSIICIDGDSFVPNNGCFGWIGHLPPDGLPCVPGKSIFGRPCLPVMTSPLPEQLAPEWRGVLSTDSTWNSCRKLFCLASIFVFSRVLPEYSIYINHLYIFE